MSGTYKNGNTKLLWELSEAPRWEAPSVRLRLTGSWCPVCARATRRSSAWLTIQEMQALASKRGGRCLSEHYKSSREKLLWECSKGHKWEALHSGIKRGRWCPSCASDARLSIKDMQSIAEERGGRYLSGAYVNTQTKYNGTVVRVINGRAPLTSLKVGVGVQSTTTKPAVTSES